MLTASKITSFARSLRPIAGLKKSAVRLPMTSTFYAWANHFLYVLALQASSHPFNEIKMKDIKIWKHSKLLSLGKWKNAPRQKRKIIFQKLILFSFWKTALKKNYFLVYNHRMANPFKAQDPRYSTYFSLLRH